MLETFENKLVGRIYGNGMGWAFSRVDFSGIGTRSPVDVFLCVLWHGEPSVE